MALIRLGNGVVDIKGQYAGTVFQRNSTGTHCSKKARKIKKRTPQQATQRRAFQRARAYSTQNRTVSYNIYRALSNLTMKQPPIDYPPIK